MSRGGHRLGGHANAVAARKFASKSISDAELATQVPRLEAGLEADLAAAVAERDALREFRNRHTMASCTNPTCDCIEARLSRAVAAVERVEAWCDVRAAEATLHIKHCIPGGEVWAAYFALQSHVNEVRAALREGGKT